MRKIAPEFYEYLPYHTSYVMVIVNYIMDKNMGPFARVFIFKFNFYIGRLNSNLKTMNK